MMLFSCENPDFTIRCLPEDVSFGVKRAKMVEGSEVFADMFSCCDRASLTNNENDGDTHIMDVYESPSDFSLLLRLLHDCPADYDVGTGKRVPDKYDYDKYVVVAPTSAIPFPVLPALLQLADKYALSLSITRTLHTHLQAHASTFPLGVYGLASRLRLDTVADAASAYLVAPPLHTYSAEEVRLIPTGEAYHRLLMLQHYRTDRLKDLLMREELFPYGYGACPSHKDTAEATWAEKKNALLPRVDAGTDVAAEMFKVIDNFGACPACSKACQAATEMLAYRCRRVARRISKLPSDAQ